VVKFENVFFSYNKRDLVINNVDLNIAQGQIHGILGHNGAGKTTTFRLLLGLLKPKSGLIQCDGFVSEDRNFPRGLISYMPESIGIYEKLTGFQNLEFRARTARVPHSQIRPKSKELLKSLRLLNRAHERAGYWSNGMKKRLSLACALISQPKLLLLDEPTSGIDPESLSIIRQILKKINNQGTTIILSSHDLNSVEKICTHISILQYGKLIYTGVLDGNISSLEEFYLKHTKKIEN